MSDFTDGLRNLADEIDRSGIDQAQFEGRHLLCYHARDEMLAAIRMLGGKWDKDALTDDDDYFGMTRDFGGNVTVYVYAPRRIVCEAVVVDTETVEIPDPELIADIPLVTVERDVVRWECPPSILAEVGAER
jgi:hypothetical protein